MRKQTVKEKQNKQTKLVEPPVGPVLKERLAFLEKSCYAMAIKQLNLHFKRI